VKETINLILTKFTDETLTISIGLMGLLFVILAAYWVYYRRKFNELKHQIPAQVVKNYLDSIIQNSSALKSSLFRGGGLDVEDGIPSVVPAADLGSTPVQVSGASGEELNQKNAEIASLRATIGDKDKTLSELEKKLAEASSGAPAPDNSAEIDGLKSKISELEAALAAAAAAPAGGGGDEEVAKQLTEVTQERDQLKEKLQEYEIIEEDLANLKRLQQENEQLKKALEAGGGSIPAPAAEEEPLPVEEPAAVEQEADPLPVEEPAAENEPEPLPVEEEGGAEELPIEDPGADAAAADSAEMGVPANDGDQKSAEELLSEFEKMLG
tara:strand:- start:48569 stop:49546 length:978 start_codon:yes stop_codon:yes gene_type:complete